MRRVALRVAADAAEQARARLLELVPAGFEEVDVGGVVELAAYVDAAGEQRLRAALPGVESEPVGDGWAERWRAFHRPVRIGPLWVGPPWEQAPRDAVAVVVDPGRAFGTGAHPTTRLCLELVLTLERGSLVDVGCGSGVLGIAAAKLGFDVLEAVDIDPVAAETAAANAERNGVALAVRTADALASPPPAADVAVTNIALEIVNALVPELEARAVVTSGYLEVERPELEGLTHADRRFSDGWAADLYRRH